MINGKKISIISPGLSNVRMILDFASVPEHSVEFMRVMSGGEPFIRGDYLFFYEHDWLMAVGYPLKGEYDHTEFQNMLNDAIAFTQAQETWLMCPALPDSLKSSRIEKDKFYVLDLKAKVPARLMNLADKASRSLHWEIGSSFTSEHKKLWEEFIRSKSLAPRVLELYKRTEKVIRVLPDLVMLNAWNREGHLVSCLLLDLAPRRFASYLIGAHSKKYYVPFATDLLFREMIALSREHDKEFIHLGLGVNPGITRFKTKWGGRFYSGYEMAFFKNPGIPRGTHILSPAVMENKTRYLLSLPEQKEFKMLWEVEKNDNLSWIGGTAHFFRYSFKYSLTKLFQKADTVIFEGPLDRVSMAFVDHVGRNPEPGSSSLLPFLSDEEIKNLEQVVRGYDGFWAKVLNTRDRDLPDVRYYLAETRPWMSFFSLWSGFLRRMGWKQSVDLEAWDLAKNMNKCVLAMESIHEQIETLESIPVERIISFLKNCGQWKSMARKNEKAYLKGDLDNMFGTSTEFPSRTQLVIHRRDELFLQRMLPYLKQGRCIVLVGTAHMFNLPDMLIREGFRVSRVY